MRDVFYKKQPDMEFSLYFMDAADCSYVIVKDGAH